MSIDIHYIMINDRNLMPQVMEFCFCPGTSHARKEFWWRETSHHKYTIPGCPICIYICQLSTWRKVCIWISYNKGSAYVLMPLSYQPLPLLILPKSDACLDAAKLPAITFTNITKVRCPRCGVTEGYWLHALDDSISYICIDTACKCHNILLQRRC